MPAAPPNWMTSERDHASCRRRQLSRDGRRPSGDLEAERDRRGRLQQRPPQHHRRCVPFREVPQRTVEPSVVGGDRYARLLEEQHQRGVGDILAGGSPMHIGGAGRIDEMNALAEGLDKRNRGRGVSARGPGDRRGVEAAAERGLGNRARGCRGNHAGGGRGPRQRALELEHRRDDAVVGENRGQMVGRGEAVEEAHRKSSFSLLPSAFSLVTDRRRPSPRFPASG